MVKCIIGVNDYQYRGCILADSMGLGKSLEMLASIWIVLNQNPWGSEEPSVKKAVIVCPLSLVNHWQKESEKWLGCQRLHVVKVLSSDDNQQLNQFKKNDQRLLIISYDQLQQQKKVCENVDLVIFDEGHRLKNHLTQLA